MPVAGNSFIVEVKQSHLDWGRYRYTHTRDRIAGEAYVKIPKAYAVAFGIHTGTTYNATFTDGHPGFRAKAAGNSQAGDVYAKQFQGDGDLKAFGRWYASLDAQVGDKVKVEFISPTDVRFTLIPSSFT